VRGRSLPTLVQVSARPDPLPDAVLRALLRAKPGFVAPQPLGAVRLGAADTVQLMIVP